jgi:hypothetical protein
LAPADDPEDVYSLDISGLDLRFILEDDLTMFNKLQILKAGENTLPFARLGLLPRLRKLILPCNDICSLDLEVEGRFSYLEVSILKEFFLLKKCVIVFGFVLQFSR